LFLSGDNRQDQPPHLRVTALFQRHLCHCDGAFTVRDHAAHEIDVRVTGVGDVHGAAIIR
jgi:hypothetical protein